MERRGAGGWVGLSVAVMLAACGDPREAEAQHEPPLEVGQTSDGLFAALEPNARAGQALFALPIPTGNGRSCATCHEPQRAFTIDPARVEERFLRSRRDPLFRSMDADDFRDDYSTLRRLAVVRVGIALHPDVRAVDAPEATTALLFRAIPSVLNVALTAPYLSDGRAPTLQEQARGAIEGHIEPRTRGLPDAAIEHIVAYELEQFSSESVRQVAEALAAGEAPIDPDPPLDELQAQGRSVFEARCLRCHGGPRGDEPRGSSKFSDVLVSRVNLAGLPEREWAFRLPDGSVELRRSPDPGLALLTGNVADFEKFEAPQLRGVRLTAPYFHDNGAATLEEVLVQYNRFFASTGRAELTAEEREALAAYLRAI